MYNLQEFNGSYSSPTATEVQAIYIFFVNCFNKFKIIYLSYLVLHIWPIQIYFGVCFSNFFGIQTILQFRFTIEFQTFCLSSIQLDFSNFEQFGPPPLFLFEDHSELFSYILIYNNLHLCSVYNILTDVYYLLKMGTLYLPLDKIGLQMSIVLLIINYYTQLYCYFKNL